MPPEEAEQVAKLLFPGYVQAQFLTMYGMLTGTASTGIVLLRELDPHFETPVSDNLIYQNFPAIIFGLPLMLIAAQAPKNPEGTFFYATTKVNQAHSDVKYVDNSFIVFGKETKGLPETLIKSNLKTCIRIPMLNIEKARSLNLSNSVAIVVYEALRQLDYPKMR